MSGGVRYWNEESQRWEDGDGSQTVTGPVTPPPSPWPGASPTWPPGVPGPVPSADEPATSSTDAAPGTPAGPPAPPVAPVWPPAAGSDGEAGADGVNAGPETVVGPHGVNAGPETVVGSAGADGVNAGPGTVVGSGGPHGVGAGSGTAVGSAAGAGPGEPPSSFTTSASPSAPPAPSLPGPPSSPSPLPPPPVGWPGAGQGGGGGWHGPGVGGSGSGDGWSSVEQVGGGGVPSAEWSGSSWATAGQPAVAPPVPGRNRRLVWSVLVGAAAVGVVTTLVLTLVVGGGDKDDQGGGGSPSPTEAVSQQSDPVGSPTPSPTEESASPLASAPELPAGYELYEDQEGFRIARPAGWTRSTVPSQFGIDVVNYRSADGEQRLQVYQIAESSPEESFRLYLSADTTKPNGFEKLDLRPVDDDGFTGERLEYVADTLSGEPDIGPWHVYDERFVAQDGMIYAIAAYGLQKDGTQDELELLTSALKGFCAPYACDPAAID
ncbi:hypothetical protein [Streptomyces shaanxiensis]